MEDIKFFAISDTTSSTVNSVLLTDEIGASGIETTLSRIDTIPSLDRLDIVFASGLPQNEFTTLSGVVSAHVGGPLFRNKHKVKIDNSEDTTSSTTFSGVLTTTTERLSAGKYIIGWYSELSVTDESLGDASQARVLCDGSVIGTSSNKTDLPVSFSGQDRITVVRGQKVTITMQLRRKAGPPVGADVVKISRKRIFINKIVEDE
jgi:hypothetical protein